MSEERAFFTCIVCPNGCDLTVTQRDGAVTVTGAGCPRGVAFGEREVTAPTRSLTTTVATTLPMCPVLPVKTAGELPKGALMRAMTEINSFKLTWPARRGDVLIDDLLGTGVALVATADTGSYEQASEEETR